ncbi:MAG: TPM domain-containing protein [Bacteriovoracaceae bacterium]|nr:TPM domain-containing protein [Bacteriovoracaceae bacterium]
MSNFIKINFFIALFFSTFLWAVEIPKLTGSVVDNAGIFRSGEYSVISSAIRNYYQKTGVQFQILTMNSLKGESIDVFSIRLAEKWRIGKKGGSGVIILAALKDRKIRIEVGGGLEGELTDVFCSRIIRQLMAPQFKKGQYAIGFAAALTTMSQKMGKKMIFTDGQMNRTSGIHRRSKRRGLSFFGLIIIFFLFRGIFSRRRGTGLFSALLLGSMLGGGGRSFGGGGGGFSGGGWSGGGGGFSGGGASGGW